MIQKLQDLLKTILTKLNFLDYQQQLSISNITVAVFVFIAAIRMAFGGSDLNLGFFIWKIQVIDIGGTLPVFYSLLNYAHKRHINNQNNGDNSK